MSKMQSKPAFPSAAVPETRPGKPPSAPVALTVEEALDLGLKLHHAGRLPEAELLYRRILDSRPDNPNALHFLGLLCHQQNRHVEAAGLIERIITLDPQNADARNNLG
ncbi:MAG TPA: tetratricopeptide repeat protein, partial [Desulfobacterales bacterium]